MTRKDRIAAALTEALRPIRLDIVDESDRHAGHSGARPGGETHYRLYIVSPAFVGKSRVERHRMVNALLAAEFASGLHALAIAAAAPNEA
jgi:BolA family transcriptional regulator, general stress-responsive regulator